VVFAAAGVDDAAGGNEVADTETNPGHPPPIGGRPKSGRRDHSPARRGASNRVGSGSRVGLAGWRAAAERAGRRQAGVRSP